MPTWSATHSLLADKEPCRNLTNCAVVAPLFRQSPSADCACELRQSVGLNKNWVIRNGDLHICFLALHGAGKTEEGTRLDTCALDSGTYSVTCKRDKSYIEKCSSYLITLTVVSRREVHASHDNKTTSS